MTALTDLSEEEYEAKKQRAKNAIADRVCMKARCTMVTARTVKGKDLPWCRDHTPEKYQDDLPPLTFCGARTEKKGKPSTCGNAAGFRTDHRGMGRCWTHDRSGPKNSARVQSAQILATATDEVVGVLREVVMGSPIEVDPHDALRTLVKIAAGEVAYATGRIQQLEEDEATFMEETVKTRPLSEGKDGESSFLTVEERTVKNNAEVNVWIKVRWQAMENLRKYSETAIKCGIAEREVKIAENLGGALAAQLQFVLEGLALTAEQEAKAPTLVRAALTKLTQGAPIVDVERVS